MTIWGAIKKTINSNFNKPLDALIEEKTGLTNATGGTATTGNIFSKLNKLLTDWTSVRAAKIDDIDALLLTLANGNIKSIQTGESCSNLGANTSVILQHAPVNVNKSIVIINGGGVVGGGDNSFTVVPRISSRTSTSITVGATYNANGFNFSWQLIEFY